MLALVNRWKLAAEDRLKYSPLVRGAFSRYKLWTDGADDGDQQALVQSIGKLCAAARFATSAAAVAAIQRTIHDRLAMLQPRRVDWTAFVDDVADPMMSRGVLLKPWLGPREKGVLFVSFEKEWFKLLQHCDLREFNERYSLVIAPSSSPHNLVNYVFPAVYPGKIFTLLSNESDKAVLPGVANNLVIVPLYASQWVLPDLFAPLPPGQRDVDLIMVANFAKVKRHFALFAALRKMPRHLRVLLVGQDQDGRTADTIKREAGYFGVADRFTVQSNVSYPGVSAALCRSRASVVLSRREGSCVVVAESLFANTPAALLEAAEIGSRAFINPATGRFLPDGDLAAELTNFVESAGNYQARAWAENTISCFRSTTALNEFVRQHALADGQEWTQDIAPLCWRPDPRLVHETDIVQLQPSRLDMKERFGIEVGPTPES
jgi:hypothetical protein